MNPKGTCPLAGEDSSCVAEHRKAGTHFLQADPRVLRAKRPSMDGQCGSLRRTMPTCNRPGQMKTIKTVKAMKTVRVPRLHSLHSLYSLHLPRAITRWHCAPQRSALSVHGWPLGAQHPRVCLKEVRTRLSVFRNARRVLACKGTCTFRIHRQLFSERRFLHDAMLASHEN